MKVGSIRGLRVGSRWGLKVGSIRGLKVGSRRGLKMGSRRGLKVGSRRGLKVGSRRGSKVGSRRGSMVGSRRGSKVGDVCRQNTRHPDHVIGTTGRRQTVRLVDVAVIDQPDLSDVLDLVVDGESSRSLEILEARQFVVVEEVHHRVLDRDGSAVEVTRA